MCRAVTDGGAQVPGHHQKKLSRSGHHQKIPKLKKIHMSGVKKGVATRIKEENPTCLYIHCYGHALNLAVSDTIRNVEQLSKSFNDQRVICKLIKNPNVAHFRQFYCYRFLVHNIIIAARAAIIVLYYVQEICT